LIGYNSLNHPNASFVTAYYDPSRLLPRGAL